MKKLFDVEVKILVDMRFLGKVIRRSFCRRISRRVIICFYFREIFFKVGFFCFFSKCLLEESGVGEKGLFSGLGLLKRVGILKDVRGFRIRVWDRLNLYYILFK